MNKCRHHVFAPQPSLPWTRLLGTTAIIHTEYLPTRQPQRCIGPSPSPLPRQLCVMQAVARHMLSATPEQSKMLGFC